MTRVLGLYDHPPADGRVHCVDEFGPLNLQPRPGHGWFRRAHPARRRATYHRHAGIRQMFAAQDLATGQIFDPDACIATTEAPRAVLGRPIRGPVRDGFTTLFAAFDVATGTVISSLHRRHRAVELKMFLVKIDTEVPAHLQIHLICDNYGTHKTSLAEFCRRISDEGH